MSDYRPLTWPDDFDTIERLWGEGGWLDECQNARLGMERWVEGCTGFAGLLDGEAEAIGVGRAGSFRYEDRELPLNLVASINVSRIARGRGLGGGVTRRVMQAGAAEGAAVSLLGIFDQGYYDKLGFGTGSYQRFVTVDPRLLNVPVPERVPVRLGLDDISRIHESRLRRHKTHGSATLPQEGATASEILWELGFGIGFEDRSGQLTHHFWCVPKGEHGPYRIMWMVWEEPSQYLDLLGVIATWRDQVMGVRMPEFGSIPLQDLMKRPFRHRGMTKGGAYSQDPTSFAWWQARILDLPAAMGAVSIAGEPIQFVLRLTDPLDLVSGDWTIVLGAESTAERGGDPQIRASVGAFSRRWLGVASGAALAVSDDFSGDPALIAELDRRWRIPKPVIDWEL